MTHWFLWLVGFIGGLGTIAYSINRIWVLWLHPAYRFIRRVWSALSRLADAAPVMVGMAEQFRNNGGSTLKDAIDEVKATSGALKATSDKHTKTLEDQNRTLEGQNKTLAILKETTTRLEEKVDQAIKHP